MEQFQPNQAFLDSNSLILPVQFVAIKYPDFIMEFFHAKVVRDSSNERYRTRKITSAFVVPAARFP